MVDVKADHMCSTIATADQTEAKVAASFPVKDK